MLDELKKSMIDAYDCEVLEPIFGDGSLKNDLRNGLELILSRLNEIESPEDLHFDSCSLFDKKIDHRAIMTIIKESGAYRGLGVRIRNGLRDYEIETYGDLIRVKNKAVEKRQEWTYTDKVKDGVRHPIYLNHVGTKAYSILYRHLDDIGIQLFEDGYNDIELGKKKWVRKKRG